MRLAFYAPLKPPHHPVPSGDRRMARLLMAALTHAGHDVTLASRLRTWDGTGDPARQTRLANLSARLAQRLLRRYRARPETAPEAWFTYHPYYKAPDWIGPHVSRTLDIPYLVAEASLAQKRAEGPWAAGHKATLEAVAQADAIVAVNPADVPALTGHGEAHSLAPFLDPALYSAAAMNRKSTRVDLADKHGLDPAKPWLLAVAMMRGGDKLASYRILAEAAQSCEVTPWHLLIAGDGPARREVEDAFHWAETGRVCFLGALEPEALARLYAASDLLVWPAINEAYGMALLEAQATGLPVLAGDSGGVSGVVHDGQTGVLVPPGDSRVFASALKDLLARPSSLRAMGDAAQARVAANHGLEAASARLNSILSAACQA